MNVLAATRECNQRAAREKWYYITAIPPWHSVILITIHCSILMAFKGRESRA